MSEISRKERIGARLAYFGFALPALTLIFGIAYVIIVARIVPASATAGVAVLVALALSFPAGFCIALTGGIVIARSRSTKKNSEN